MLPSRSSHALSTVRRSDARPDVVHPRRRYVALALLVAMIATLTTTGTVQASTAQANDAASTKAAEPAPDRAGRPGGPAAPVAKFPPKTHPDFIDVPAKCQNPDGQPRVEACWLTPRKKGAPIIYLWGDSHAWQMIPALRKAVQGRNVNLVSWIIGGCTPMFTKIVRGTTNLCVKSGNLAMEWLERKVRKEKRKVYVVYGASWELYNDVTAPKDAADKRYPGFANDWITTNARTALTAMPKAFRKMNSLGVPVDLVGQMPMIWVGAPDCPLGEFQCSLPRWGVIKDAKRNNARIEQMRNLISKGRRVIRPARYLCTTDICRGRMNGVPVYLDRLHIGQRTSVNFAPYFKGTVDRAVRLGTSRKR